MALLGASLALSACGSSVGAQSAPASPPSAIVTTQAQGPRSGGLQAALNSLVADETIAADQASAIQQALQEYRRAHSPTSGPSSGQRGQSGAGWRCLQTALQSLVDRGTITAVQTTASQQQRSGQTR